MSQDQISANYEAYVAKYRGDLERDHNGKVALIRNGELIEVHDNYDDAYWHGIDEFGLGDFSIQEIGDQPAQLGVLSFAL